MNRSSRGTKDLHMVKLGMRRPAFVVLAVATLASAQQTSRRKSEAASAPATRVAPGKLAAIAPAIQQAIKGTQDATGGDDIVLHVVATRECQKWPFSHAAQVDGIWAHCGCLAHCVDELVYTEFGEEYGELPLF